MTTFYFDAEALMAANPVLSAEEMRQGLIHLPLAGHKMVLLSHKGQAVPEGLKAIIPDQRPYSDHIPEGVVVVTVASSMRRLPDGTKALSPEQFALWLLDFLEGENN